MGLADRDYMRERRRRDEELFRPPVTKSPSILWILFCWICAAFLLFKAFAWWEQKPSSPRHRTTQQAHAVPAPRSEAPPTAPGADQRSQQRTTPAVTKCIHNGVTTYSDSGCEPGPASQSVQLAAMPTVRQSAEPAPAAAPEGTTPGTIYLCKGYDGGTFWAQAHCNRHRALIDRIAHVPEGMPFQQQVQIAQQQLQGVRQAQAATAHTSGGGTSAAIGRTARCAALDAFIKQIDARARQPLSGQEQDRLAAQRKEARSEQFRIPCR